MSFEADRSSQTQRLDLYPGVLRGPLSRHFERRWTNQEEHRQRDLLDLL